MTKKRVLIADDDRQVHGVYRECIGDDYEYLSAVNGVDALVLAVDLVPDLVILDIAMPILDGRAVCKKLKEYPKTKGIKVLMVSGRDEQSDRVLGFEVGADEYLAKPLGIGLLKSRVEKLLR